MFPHENLFVGDLGKTEQPLASRFMTTPITRKLDAPSYVIDVPVSVSGKFVCCTLNGQLWMYETSEGEYLLIALKWNDTEGKLEYAASDALSSEAAPIARGIDWVLFPNAVMQVMDEPPYIATSDIARNQSGKYCYSLLRSKIIAERPSGMRAIIGSGIDPFTLQAWGLGNAGNTEGWGYFNTSLGGASLYPSGTHIMEACYSTLPSVGDWVIVEDFLIRRPNNPLEGDSGSFLQQSRPLIPLEFNWYSEGKVYPTYGVGCSASRRGIQLAAGNGTIWGRGFMHIGQAFILPAAFGENGVEEFYLYISASGCNGPYNQASTPLIEDDDNPWLSLGITLLSGDVVGFISEQKSPVEGSICQTAATAELFLPQTGRWVNPRPEDGGKMALDFMNGAGLVLGEKGVTFITGIASNGDVERTDYYCAAMSDWLAPARQLEGIGRDIVLSSFKNALLITNVQTGFNRILLQGKTLPLTWGTLEKKDENTGDVLGKMRLSIGNVAGDAARITVDEIAYHDTSGAGAVNSIPWEDIYKEAVSIRLLNAQKNLGFDLNVDYYGAPGFVQGVLPILLKKRSYSWDSYWDYTSWTDVLWPTSASYEIYAIDPETGELVPQTVNVNLSSYYDHPPYADWPLDGSVNYVTFSFPAIEENQVGGIVTRIRDYRPYLGFPSSSEEIFIPLNIGLPSWWDSEENLLWGKKTDGVPGLAMSDVFLIPSCEIRAMMGENRVTMPPKRPCFPSVLFTEASTKTKFLLTSADFGCIAEGGEITGPLADFVAPYSYVEYDYEPGVMVISSALTTTTECSTFLSHAGEGYQGETKYAKALYVWSIRRTSLDFLITDERVSRDVSSCVFVIRADLNPDVFDFDAELVKAKLF